MKKIFLFMVLTNFCPIWIGRLMAAPSNISCHTTPGPAATGTVCVNTTNEVIQVRVSFRKMPSWGGQASFLLVDMCEISGKDPATEGPCIRRYCSEDSRAFEFSINGLTIPSGFMAFSFWLGTEKTKFELRCRNIQ